MILEMAIDEARVRQGTIKIEPEENEAKMRR